MEFNHIDHRKKSDEWWNTITEEEFQSKFRISRRSLTDLQAEIDYVEAIQEERIEKLLLASLWFLGCIEPLNTASTLFGIKNPEGAIQDYLTKLLKLATLYILWPAAQEAESIEKGFVSQYKFPNVIGVIGSLHIDVNIQNVSNKNVYFNKLMKKHTIVLQVVCDHNLLLRDVCVGCPGGKGIRSILEASPLFELLTHKENILAKFNHHLLGGTEHPQLNTLLTPYKLEQGRALTEAQYNFNTMHGSVMSSMEATFRCMENRFPRLTSVEDLTPEFAALVVGAICVLHNFTRVRNDNCNVYS